MLEENRVIVDTRLEFITALVIAYKKDIAFNKDKYDWVEYYDNSYVHELVEKIAIKEYEEIYKYLENITFCDIYTELYLYLDNEMNYTAGYTKEPFKDLSIVDFGKIIHKIYIDRNLKSFFENASERYNNLITFVNNIMFDNNALDEVNKFYNIEVPDYHIVVSLLFNGSFGFEFKGKPYILRSIEYKDDKYILNKNLLLQKFFHEISHPIVNALVDKHRNEIKVDDTFLEEAINNGLPTCYQRLYTLLYEYFVRINELYLIKSYVNESRYKESIEWAKKIGFTYIDNLVDLLVKKRFAYKNYEDVLTQELIPCLNKINNK